MLTLAVLALALVCAAAVRRWSPARAGLSVAATTIWSVLGSGAAAVVVMSLVRGPWRPPLTLLAAAAAALGAVHAAAWVNVRARRRAARRRAARRPERVPLWDRAESFADAHPLRVGGHRLLPMLVHGSRRVAEVRVTGLAAEMTYYALISLVPLVTALGAGLGFLERVVGAEQVARIESTVVGSVTRVFDDQVATEVLTPLVEGLLREERAGVAIGGLLVALWLASRMFRAAVRALDDAYRVPERRGFWGQQALGLGLSVGAVVTLLLVLTMVVVGPLLGAEQRIADLFGGGSFLDVAWTWLRWPVLAAVSIAYLTLLYRYGPNIRTTWRRCLPGAVLGTAGLVLVAAGFQVYLGLSGSAGPEVGTPGGAVRAAAQMLGAILAGVLWLWLSSIVILGGGVVNAELERERDLAAARGRGEDGAPERAGETRDGPVGAGRVEVP